MMMNRRDALAVLAGGTLFILTDDAELVAYR